MLVLLPCLQAAQLMSAAMGPVNTFDVTVNAGPQYSTVACSGSTCNLDISYFARTYGGLSSPAGQFLKVVVKCACGPGYQAMTPAANSSSSGNNTSSTGSASLTCVPCGAGWYRCGPGQPGLCQNTNTTRCCSQRAHHSSLLVMLQRIVWCSCAGLVCERFSA